MVNAILEAALSFIVGVIASGIAIKLLEVFYKKRRSFHLFWGVGMALWAVSAFAQGYAIVIGWTVPLYKSYYFSAISLAGFLGAGTLGLIIMATRKRVYQIYSVFVLVTVGILAFNITLAAVNTTVLEEAVIGGLALPSSVRLFAPIINIPAAFTFIGGAAYSFIRTRKMYALLIAFGAAIPAVGGSFARFAIPFLLPFTDFIGIILLSAGFYLSFKPTIRSMETRVPV